MNKKQSQNSAISNAVPSLQPHSSRPRRWKWGALSLILVISTSWWFGGMAGWWRWRTQQELERRHPDAAWQFAQRLLSWTGSTPETEFLLARICRRQGLFAEMETHLQCMSQGTGRSPRLREQQNRERILAAAQTGQLDKTEDALNAYLQDPRDDGREICEVYLNACLANGRDREARTILEGWQATVPPDPLPAYFLGLIREHNEEFDGAEKSYSESLRIQQDNYACYYARGRVRMILNQVEGALADYHAAALGVPYPAAAQIGEARCLKTLGQLDPARAILQRVVRLPSRDVLTSYQRYGHFPEYLAAEYELGTLELESGHADIACPLLKRVADEAPHYLEGRQAYGDALRSLGKSEEAQVETRFVQSSRKAMLEVDRLLAELKHQPQDPEEKRDFLADRNTRIGELYLRYSSPKTGILYLRRALAERPDFSRARELLSIEERPRRR